MSLNLFVIAKAPTTVIAVPAGASGVHESVMRSFQLLELVKDYLQRGVPGDVILELIRQITEQPGSELGR